MANRVALITGSSRGIGLATAEEFLKNGDNVVLFCRHEGHVAAAKEKLNQIGPRKNILDLVGDVRNYRDVQRIVAESLKKFGRIDVLVNNAGVAIWKSIEETSETEWDEVLATNLKGQFLFLREVLPLMKKQKSGVVINISSGLGVQGEAKYSAYASSKFGIIGLTEVAADENKNTNLKIYAVLPGAVATKLHLDLHPWEDPSNMMTPAYVAKKILALAEGKKKTGELVEVYD